MIYAFSNRYVEMNFSLCYSIIYWEIPSLNGINYKSWEKKAALFPFFYMYYVFIDSVTIVFEEKRVLWAYTTKDTIFFIYDDGIATA